jgi:hypothetical protein
VRRPNSNARNGIVRQLTKQPSDVSKRQEPTG